MLVHVMAWHYNGGAGFNWYRTPADADSAFAVEKGTVDSYPKDNWTAFRFDVEVENVETATAEIDATLDALCAGSQLSYGPGLEAINAAAQ